MEQKTKQTLQTRNAIEGVIVGRERREDIIIIAFGITIRQEALLTVSIVLLKKI
jgi:hypothetical protein